MNMKMKDKDEYICWPIQSISRNVGVCVYVYVCLSPWPGSITVCTADLWSKSKLLDKKNNNKFKRRMFFCE